MIYFVQSGVNFTSTQQRSGLFLYVKRSSFLVRCDTHTGLFIAIWCGNLFGEKVTNFIISLIRGKSDHTEVNYERKNVLSDCKSIIFRMTTHNRLWNRFHDYGIAFLKILNCTLLKKHYYIQYNSIITNMFGTGQFYLL